MNINKKLITMLILLAFSTSAFLVPQPVTPSNENTIPMGVMSDTSSEIDGMALLPAGEFEMGDHHNLGGREHGNDEVPIHTVYVDSFFIATTETTNQQYADFLNSAFTNHAIEVRDGNVYGTGSSVLFFQTRQSDQYSPINWDGSTFSVIEGREDHPVTSVRWYGAAAYTTWLSNQQGYEGCYDIVTWVCDFTKSGYRLPTEAEWEYAGRGGQYEPYSIFPWGDEADNSRANWPHSGDPYETGPQPWTTPVGFYNGDLHQQADFNWPGSQESYQTSDGANSYGLYDMAGNVWEWVNDWYARDYYSQSPYENPPGPDRGTPAPDGNTYHVVRGGNWYNGEWGHSRVSNRNLGYYRGPGDPNHAWYHYGFRVVLDDHTLTSRGTKVAQSIIPQTLDPSDPNNTVGLILNTDQAYQGYTLFAPKHNTMTYLIDNNGRVVHEWTTSQYEPGQSVYLLENGHLLRACFVKSGHTGGGEGGRIEEYDWDGNLVWEFDYATDKYTTHHDIEPLPNGNILALVVNVKTRDEAIAAGFDPGQLSDNILLPDSVIEIEKTGSSGGNIVWEWDVWDHLIQDRDPSKDNYGVVADHPELVDVSGTGRRVHYFWNHMNSIDYNAELDQIMLSVRGNSELWVIDHSTTTEEAASHSGGRYGKGGDLLYRWGNPATYSAGNASDRTLFEQHDAQWIEAGYPGEGNILVFNNGLRRPDGNYSSVDEIVPPVDENGNYTDPMPGSAYEPTVQTWVYTAENQADFYSEAISGAQRLPNGNTLICDGVHGIFFEVSPQGEIVWKYVNPVVKNGSLSQGDSPGLDHRGHNWNAVFKVQRYSPDYPGLAGRDLTPGNPIENVSVSG